ncbi:CYSTEINE PROTEASE RD19C-RELATED [Salix koriyanagi]|uniref:CYSTEINE PROTEASE RD19C-RELATED n=1 Tax=Salix koriyanagi TaxID=2511006 RepID=A0A9Q0UZU9_9ROSI|nr:CYSTEINE PROTEASE RD19C-RELATED [Salix koriyanagi]
MSLNCSLYVILSLLFISAVYADTLNGDDPLIRQVVDGQDTSSSNLLNAEQHHFSQFKSKFKKSYGSQDEHDYRFSVLGLRRLRLPKDANKAPILPTSDLPEDFDWRDKGAVGPVKNQGSCGSCWSFSATGALEGAHFLATGELVSLSEQQLVDCDHECDPEEPGSCDSGCNGGLMNSAFEYSLKAGGLMREEDYPYTDQIAANLVKNGPLAVAINAVFMQTYIGGVSCPYICSRRLDHGVLLVGYGSAGYAPVRMKEKPYWIIKNSWGEKWGENGFYKICRGRNVCGVDSMVSTVAAVQTSSQ